MSEHATMPPCDGCLAALRARQHSTCFACGHEIDHATGHECPMWDDF